VRSLNAHIDALANALDIQSARLDAKQAEIYALKKFHADEEQNRRALVAKIDEQQAEIDDLKAQVARIVAAVPSAGSRALGPSGSPYDLTDEEKALASGARSASQPFTSPLIEAIKMVRARTGCDLYEAKQAVDAYRFGRATR
jgi:ribosomal protein L7/L12